MSEILKLTNVRHSYVEDAPLIEDFSLTVGVGEIVALAGKNGCGKTTLLKIAGGLLKPNAGDVQVCGKDPSGARPSISFIFQNPTNQIIGTTVFEDIMFGLRNIKIEKKLAEKKTKEILSHLNIDHLSNAPTYKLSGGEAQMVAIAGSLVTEPKLLLADEPTSMLDESHSQIFRNMLKNKVEDGLCVLTSTHDSLLQSIATKVLQM